MRRRSVLVLGYVPVLAAKPPVTIPAPANVDPVEARLRLQSPAAHRTNRFLHRHIHHGVVEPRLWLLPPLKWSLSRLTPRFRRVGLGLAFGKRRGAPVLAPPQLLVRLFLFLESFLQLLDLLDQLEDEEDQILVAEIG